MASNIYYYGGSGTPEYNANAHAHAHAHANSASHPYQHGGNYSSTDEHLGQQTPYAADGSSKHLQHPHATGPSPFASVFDDSYATNSSTSLPHQGIYPDTTYHGQGGPVARPHDDDIPLQDRTAKNGDVTDHIYDAPERGMASRTRKKKKKGIRFGELGMLGSDKKRIPWVCYVFSVIQVGVFVGEIIKNGKQPRCAIIVA